MDKEENECAGKLLYYPGYVIQNESFLNYALLHLETLYVIWPEEESLNSGDGNDLLKYIWKNSNLIERYIPSRELGDIASDRAIKRIQWYIRSNRIMVNQSKAYNGKEYRRCYQKKEEKFWDYYFQHNLNCEMIHHSFANSFEHYCIGNHLAERRGSKIFISQCIANMYYAELVKTIAELDNKKFVTDDARFASVLRKMNTEIQLYKEGNNKEDEGLSLEVAVAKRQKYERGRSIL